MGPRIKRMFNVKFFLLIVTMLLSFNVFSIPEDLKKIIGEKPSAQVIEKYNNCLVNCQTTFDMSMETVREQILACVDGNFCAARDRMAVLKADLLRCIGRCKDMLSRDSQNEWECKYVQTEYSNCK
jgi:hypothetical protein